MPTALRRRLHGGGSWSVDVSLARTAEWLTGLGSTVPGVTAHAGTDLVEFTGPFGRTRHVPCPGEIAGYRPRWQSPPRPLGFDPPRWSGS